MPGSGSPPRAGHEEVGADVAAQAGHPEAEARGPERGRRGGGARRRGLHRPAARRGARPGRVAADVACSAAGASPNDERTRAIGGCMGRGAGGERRAAGRSSRGPGLRADRRNRRRAPRGRGSATAGPVDAHPDRRRSRPARAPAAPSWPRRAPTDRPPGRAGTAGMPARCVARRCSTPALDPAPAPGRAPRAPAYTGPQRGRAPGAAGGAPVIRPGSVRQ